MRMRTLLILFVLVVSVLGSLSLLPAISAQPSSARTGPAPVSPYAPSAAAADQPVLAPAAPASAHATPPWNGNCTLAANDALYYNMVSVSFNPYAAGTAGGMAPLPTIGNVSQYARAISVIVTPNSPATTLNEVILTVWATWWNNQTAPSTPTTAPGQWTLPIKNNTATGILNDEKYFPPGSTVYFNLTMYVSNATLYQQPIWSPCQAPYPVRPWWTLSDAPTWEYTVGGGWPTGGWQSALKITAFPNIFNNTYPGPFQPVTFHLSSIGGVNIGGANFYYNVSIYDPLTGNTTTKPGGGQFEPENTTNLSVTIGPYYSVGNDTKIDFYVLAWEDWSGGAVNYIKLPGYQYSYPITNGGTWCDATHPFNYYVNLTTGPQFAPYDLIWNHTKPTLVPALSPHDVNVSVETVNPNTTISYAVVLYNETHHGSPTITSGNFYMTEKNATTFYSGDGSQPQLLSLMPLLNPGTNLSFYVEAFDGLRCEIKSPTYNYYSNENATPIINGTTFFYVTAVDAAKNSYASGAEVIFQNKTWESITYTNGLGFAYPNVTNSPLPAYLHMNQFYNVTVNWSGESQFLRYFLSINSTKTLTFYFDTSSTEALVYSQPNPTYGISLIAGLAVAAVVLIPVYSLWRDLRKRAEAEEKRITL